MICTVDKNISINKLVDAHMQNLTNIQNIISRLCNVGYTLLTLAITILSIILPLIYTLNISKLVRLALSLVLLTIELCFFITHFLNLKNERIWRNIYDKKITINVFGIANTEENPLEKILFYEFKEIKKNNKSINFCTCLKSWLIFSWIAIFLSIIATIIVILFLY